MPRVPPAWWRMRHVEGSHMPSTTTFCREKSLPYKPSLKSSNGFKQKRRPPWSHYEEHAGACILPGGGIEFELSDVILTSLCFLVLTENCLLPPMKWYKVSS